MYLAATEHTQVNTLDQELTRAITLVQETMVPNTWDLDRMLESDPLLDYDSLVPNMEVLLVPSLQMMDSLIVQVTLKVRDPDQQTLLV